MDADGFDYPPMYGEDDMPPSPDDDLNDETFGVEVIQDDDNWELERLAEQTRNAGIHHERQRAPVMSEDDNLLIAAMLEASMAQPIMESAPQASALPADPNSMFASSHASLRTTENAAQFGLDLSNVWAYNSSLHSPAQPAASVANSKDVLPSSIVTNIEQHIAKRKHYLAGLMSQMTDPALTVEQREQITGVYVEMYNEMKALQQQLDVHHKQAQLLAMAQQKQQSRQQQQPSPHVMHQQPPPQPRRESPVVTNELPKRAMTITELEEQLLSQAAALESQNKQPPPPNLQQRPPPLNAMESMVRPLIGSPRLPPPLLPPEMIMHMMQQPQLRQQIMNAAIRGQQMPPGFPPAHIFLRSPFAMPPPPQHMIRGPWPPMGMRMPPQQRRGPDVNATFSRQAHRGRYDFEQNPHGTWQGNLVSKREREWLIKIYSLGLQETGNPYVDDFYWTMYKHKSLQRENVDAHIPADDHVPYVYKPKQFEGALGRPSAVTAAGPRTVIDVTSRQRIDSEGDDRTTRHKTNLMLIERAWTLLIEAEDKQRHVVKLDSDVHEICRKAYDNYLGGPTRLLQLLAIGKCSSLIARLLVLCSPATTTAVLCDLTSQLYMLAKRDVMSNVYHATFAAIYTAVSRCNTDELAVIVLPLNANVVKTALMVKSKLVISLLLCLLYMMARRSAVVAEDGKRMQLQHWLTHLYEHCRAVESSLPEWYKLDVHWSTTAVWLRDELRMNEEDLERIGKQLFKQAP